MDNPYSFAHKQFDIETVSSLTKTTIIKSDLKDAEAEWCLKRLAKIDLIDSILPDMVEDTDENGEFIYQSDGCVFLVENKYKKKAMVYTLKRIVDRGLISRTRDGWYVKMIHSYQNKERNRDDSASDILGKTDEQLEKEKEENMKP